ncbi:MAG: hypothetical protein GY947_05040 [Rhodobacteraceae bacterium]|nr:hypothetical protein [Paracoccaceae bacterium]
MLQTLYFDAKGRRVYWTGRKGYKVVFKPFDCDYHFGKCNYSYRVNAENYENDGQGRDFVQNTVKKGNQYVATWLVGGDKDRKGGQLFSLGKYNLRTKLQYFNKGMQTVDLVKVE